MKKVLAIANNLCYNIFMLYHFILKQETDNMKQPLQKALMLVLACVFLLRVTVGYCLPVSGAVISTVTPTVSIGNGFMVALDAMGHAYAWGDNTAGNLGNGTTSSQTNAVAVTMPDKVTFVAIAAGANHVVALAADGDVYTWGSNATGQLGYEQGSIQTTPRLVEALADKTAMAVAAGNGFSMALMQDGTVYTWGTNANGELGVSASEVASFRTSPTVLGGNMENLYFIKISAGPSSAAAVTASGTVYLWGRNASGQLGTSSVAKLLPFSPTSLTSCAEIALGESHSVALLSDGSIKNAGLNDKGQFGVGTTYDALCEFFRAANLTSPKPIVDVAAGTQHTVALSANGTVYTWGYNNQGQLGYSGSTTQTSPKAVTLGDGIVASSVAAAYNNSAIVTAEGRVYAFGANGSGQLGNGLVSDNVTSPAAVLGPNGIDPLNLGMGSEDIKQDVYISIKTNVPAPTFTVTIPAEVPFGTLNQKNENAIDRYSETAVSVGASDVSFLFGEKKLVISLSSADASGEFLLRDVNDPTYTLPFNVYTEQPGERVEVTPGGRFAEFTADGRVNGCLRIDQSLINRNGSYSGTVTFTVSVEPLSAEAN